MAKEIGKSEIAAFQVSSRGGKMVCNIRDDGKAVLSTVSKLFL
nr:hypothetical protein [Campylobacter concisus]